MGHSEESPHQRRKESPKLSIERRDPGRKGAATKLPDCLSGAVAEAWYFLTLNSVFSESETLRPNKYLNLGIIRN